MNLEILVNRNLLDTMYQMSEINLYLTLICTCISAISLVLIIMNLGVRGDK